jgi:hypothetical protein
MDLDDYDDIGHPKCLLITLSIGIIIELYVLFNI